MGAPNLPAAFFVSQDITERPVTLGDGSVHKLHFREPGSKYTRRFYLAAASARDAEGTLRTQGADELDLATAALIAAALVDVNGAPVLTVEQALSLKFEVQASLVGVIRGAPTPGKPSSEGAKSGPGSSSRKGSAGAASLNGKRRSRKPSSAAGSSSSSLRDG